MRLRTLVSILLLVIVRTPAARGASLGATLVTPVDDSLPQSTAIELLLDRAPAPGERIVLELGAVDLTDLFRRRGRSWVYRAELMPLPPGEADLVVTLQTADGAAEELLRQAVRVRTRHGLDDFEARPTADLEGSGQVDSGGTGDGGAGSDGFEAASGQFRLAVSGARARWRFETEMSLLGVSERERALRFAERGEDADRLDLAGYRLRLAGTRGAVELGHTSFGDQRHLVSGFASRGLLADVALGSRSRLQVFAASGSQIVGFDNLTGLSRSAHRILAGTFVLAREDAQGLRLELSYLDGSLLPLADFNQGVVNDAERSRGFAVRVAGSPVERLQIDVGYSASQFENPEDPSLDQGAGVVAAGREDRAAYFADVDLVLVRRSPESGWANDLTLSLDHERVEPLYRSTAAYVQADVERSRVALSGTSGPIAYTLAHSRSQDNLDDVPSILETRVRGWTLNLALPLARLFDGGRRSGLLPTWTLASERTHQFGVALPENGDFAASHVPDQVSLRHVMGLRSQGSRWSLGYELSLSEQDNRQPGRENDDFDQTNHALRFDLSPLPELDLGLEVARERAAALAAGEVVRTERPAVDLAWRMTDRLQWRGSSSRTETRSDAALAVSRLSTIEGGYRLAWSEDGAHGIGGQLVLRYADEDTRQEDTLFCLSFDRREWTLQVGLNLSFH